MIIGDEFTSNIGTVPFHTAFGEEKDKFDFSYKSLADMISLLSYEISCYYHINEHNRTLKDELHGVVIRGEKRVVDKEIFPDRTPKTCDI